MRRKNFTLTVLALITGLLLVCEAVSAAGTNEPFSGTGKVLVRGAAIHASNGLRFDSKDRLYIASIMGREIVVMDPKTGKIIERLGTDVGVESPSDLVFGPEGTEYEGYLYFTSLLTGYVTRLSPDGVFDRTQYVGPGTSPITFSDDGRLFVALDFMGEDALYELDPEFEDSPRLIAENLGWFQAMDFGPDGYLYGPIWTQGKVVRIDVDSCENSSSPYTDCDIQTVTDGLGVPAAVKFDSKGRLYVNDTLRGEVLRVDTETGDKKVIAKIEPGLDNLAFDSKDRLFVSSFTDGFIIQVLFEDDDDDPCGETRIVSRGGMISPLGVAVLPSPRGESVFVGDFQSLREYDGRTGNLLSIERNLLIPGTGITTPSTVAADGENLVLSTWFGSVVQVWNPQTRELVEQYLDFFLPQNAIQFQGDLVVAEFMIPIEQPSRVVRRDKDTGDIELLASGFYVPAGLAATEDDLWVSDWATGIVWQIVVDGEPLEIPIPVAWGFSHPEGLAVDLDGNLLVIDSGTKQLSRINLETGVITVLVEGLEINAEAPPNYPPNWGFNGVAVGPSGYIYITGNVTNVLYRFKPTADIMREG